MNIQKFLLGTLVVLWGTSLLQGGTFAQEEQSFSWDVAVLGSELSQDAAFKSAVDEVTYLRLSLFDFRQSLKQMDAAEREKNQGKLDQQYKEARVEMIKVIHDLDNSSLRITKLLQRLYEYKLKLTEQIQQLTETKGHLEVWKQYLNQLLYIAYKMQREIYDESWDHIDELKVFAKTSQIPQLLAGNDTLQILLVQINELLKQATVKEKEKTELISSLVKLKTDSQKALLHYSSEIQKLKQKKEYLATFMKLYKEKKLAIALLTGAAAESKWLHEAINEMVSTIVSKNIDQTSGIPEAIKTLNEKTDSSENEKSPVAWPSYPVRQILTIFKDPSFEKENGYKNLGIELAVEQWTPVYSMRDGVVYHTDTGSGAISWLMIIHSDGYISTYAYMSSIAVKKGDIVRRGQFIGTSGGEPGTEGAGFLSKSANLTFQLFKDGVAIDPLTVLDLSVVQDKEKVLPEEYRLKYFNDHYVRPINVENLTFIKGDTVDQRAQTFLNNYAVGVYKDLAFWDQVVAGTNIDRDMVICIGFAESTLGKFLATDNNIGNVGNNDRGDRIAYENPYNGARLIPFTLNNQYLGNYHTIKQLSRYGNSDGKIYASSPINWQSNVQKCLSKIKAYYVPEDFPFRTGVNPNAKANAWAEPLKTERNTLLSGATQTKLAGIPVTSKKTTTWNQ